jgi:HSP20 family protein
MTWLQQQLEDLVLPGAGASIRGLPRGTFPAVNVGSTPDSVEVVAFMPGIDPKAVDLSVERGLLTISGERTSELPQGGDGAAHTYAQERFAGKFRRVLSLPEDADPTKVEAKFRDGVLHVSMAKRESSKPRRISVE